MDSRRDQIWPQNPWSRMMAQRCVSTVGESWARVSGLCMSSKKVGKFGGEAWFAK